MTKHEWFLPLAYDIAQVFGGRYAPAFEAEFKAKGLDWSDVTAVQMAVAAEPEPMTAARYLARVPYHATATVEAELAAAAEHGLLASDGNGGYRPTELGREIYGTGLGLVATTAAELADRLPPGADRLADLLWQQVEGCLASAIGKPALTLSRSFDFGPEAAPIHRIRRYNLDLISFRDDAHAAAWRPYGVSGYAWEAFSHVWGENIWGDPVDTLPAVVEKLGFRGYDEAAYAVALASLVERGWLAEADGTYRITDAGREIRQAAEDATDVNYYGPWQLGEGEAAELRELMEAVKVAMGAEGEGAE